MEKDIRKEAMKREIQNIIIINTGKPVGPDDFKNDLSEPTKKTPEDKLEKSDEKVSYDKQSDDQQKRCIKCVSYVAPEINYESPACIRVKGIINQEGGCLLFEKRKEVPESEKKPVRM